MSEGEVESESAYRVGHNISYFNGPEHGGNPNGEAARTSLSDRKGAKASPVFGGVWHGGHTQPKTPERNLYIKRNLRNVTTSILINITLDFRILITLCGSIDFRYQFYRALYLAVILCGGW